MKKKSDSYLILRHVPLSLQHPLDPPRHRLSQPLTVVRRELLTPQLQKGLLGLGDVGGVDMKVHLSQMPEVFNGVQVRRTPWPIKEINLHLLKPPLGPKRHMTGGSNLHEDLSTMIVHVGEEVLLNCLDTPFGIHGLAFRKDMKPSPTLGRKAAPYHNRGGGDASWSSTYSEDRCGHSQPAYAQTVYSC